MSLATPWWVVAAMFSKLKVHVPGLNNATCFAITTATHYQTTAIFIITLYVCNSVPHDCIIWLCLRTLRNYYSYILSVWFPLIHSHCHYVLVKEHISIPWETETQLHSSIWHFRAMFSGSSPVTLLLFSG
jgi:hypothetical protein